MPGRCWVLLNAVLLELMWAGHDEHRQDTVHVNRQRGTQSLPSPWAAVHLCVMPLNDRDTGVGNVPSPERAADSPVT